MPSRDKTGHLIWPAKDYAVGAFIQHHFSETLLSQFNFEFKPRDHWLDIGCGDGSFTLALASQITEGKVVGVDPSEDMIAIASQRKKPDYVSFRCEDVLKLSEHDRYHVVTAFWSLQWVSNIERALTHIHHALKPGGRFFIVYPAPDCLFMKLVNDVVQSRRIPALDHFKSPVHLHDLTACETHGEKLGFKVFHGEEVFCDVELPDLDTFRRFLNGIPIFKAELTDSEIATAYDLMTEAFVEICERDHDGRTIFADRAIVLTGIKSPRVIELNPEQRSVLIEANFPRGDLDTPRSQVQNAVGDHAHLGSSIKPHEKFRNQPKGDDSLLSQQTSDNRAAQERALQPELTPSPSAKLQAQAVLSAKPTMTPKPGG